MIKEKIILPAFNTVAAGKTASLVLPEEYRYHNISLCGSGTSQTLTNVIADVRLKVGGNQQIVLDALAELDGAANKLNGAIYGVQNNVSGGPFTLPIMFGEDFRKEYRSQDGLALPVNRFASFGKAVTLEVDIKSGATAPALEAIATVDRFEPETSLGMTKLKKWLRDDIAVGGTSADINTTCVIPAADFLNQLSLFDPTGATITRVAIKYRGQIIFDRTKRRQDDELTRLGLTPVSGRFDFVPDESDILDDAIPGDGRALQIHCDFSTTATGNVRVLRSLIGPAVL